MCFPVRLLKCFVGFNAWVTLLLGLVALITAPILQHKLNTNSDFFQGAPFTPQGFIISYYIFGSALVLFALFGIVGGIKRNSFCLFVYNILVVAVFIAFAAIGIAASVATNQLGLSNSENCLAQSWSNSIQLSVAEGADQRFCKPGCTCYIKDPTIFPPNYLNNYTYSQDASFAAVVEYNKCPNYVFSTEYVFLQSSELTFQCSGWCNVSPIFEYTDVNLGKPSGISCFVKVNNLIRSYGTGTAVISLLLAFFMLLTLLFSCCLCCHPDNKNKAHSNYYQRMAYYDQ